MPVSHVEPDDPHAVELSSKVKKQLGLDSKRSWAVTDQLNRFTWPGHDLRAISRQQPDQCAWGFLPDEILERIKAGIRANRTTGRLKQVPRD